MLDKGAAAEQGCLPTFALVYAARMNERSPLEDLRERISEALRNSPAQDMEKNLLALVGAFFDRFDLARREDLDLHRKVLERAQAKLAALEARIAELESRRP